MIVKRRHGKVKLEITKHMRAGHYPDSHTIVINLKDFKDVALLLQDLKDLYGVPVEKAIIEFQKPKSKTWPF